MSMQPVGWNEIQAYEKRRQLANIITGVIVVALVSGLMGAWAAACAIRGVDTTRVEERR